MNRENKVLQKKILLLEDIMVITSIVILLAACLLASLTPDIEEWLRVVILSLGLLPLFVSIFIALSLEQMIGYHKCEHCGHENIPSLKQIIFAPHVGRTRYLKCEKCNEKSWQKKII